MLLDNTIMTTSLWAVIQFAMLGVVHGQQCTNGSTILSKRFPIESEYQSRVVMVFPSSYDFWKQYLSMVRANIADVARRIAKYQPVDMIANPDQVMIAKMMCGSKVNVIPMPCDDLWARDTLPAFLEKDDGTVYGVNFNFNGWGNNQAHNKDALLAARVLEYYGLECVDSGLVGEPGGFESDGAGTLLLTESAWINDNRNKGKTRDEVENILKEKLGVKTVIWIKGVKGKDITDCHIDALARFAEPGTVVLSKPFRIDPNDVWSIAYEQAKQVLKDSTDARGKILKIIEISEPNPGKLSIGYNAGESFLSTYLNYLVINDAVIMPMFGDIRADQAAKNTLEGLYPKRVVELVNIDYVARGGGGIHCATHDIIGKRTT